MQNPNPHITFEQIVEILGPYEVQMVHFYQEYAMAVKNIGKPIYLLQWYIL